MENAENPSAWVRLGEVAWEGGWADLYVCRKPAPGPNPNLGAGPGAAPVREMAVLPPARDDLAILIEEVADLAAEPGALGAARAERLRQTPFMTGTERWALFELLIGDAPTGPWRTLLTRLRDRCTPDAAEVFIYMKKSREGAEEFLDRAARKQGVRRSPGS